MSFLTNSTQKIVLCFSEISKVESKVWPCFESEQSLLTIQLATLFQRHLYVISLQFLEACGLESYLGDFKEKGYDDMKTLLSLTKSELKEAFCHIGMSEKPGHQVKLKNALRIERSKLECPLTQQTMKKGNAAPRE